MSTTRITKAMYYADIRAILEGKNETPNNIDLDNLVSFVDREIELLTKKNNTTRKPTATQKENENYKTLIVDFLTSQDHGLTCTEIQKSIAELEDFTNQKIAALMNALVKSGQVKKESIKNKTLFSIA